MNAADPGCWFHGPEPVGPEHARVCGECGHAFTAGELVRRDLLVRLELDRDALTTCLNQLINVLRVRGDADEARDVARGWLDATLEDVTTKRVVDDVTIC